MNPTNPIKLYRLDNESDILIPLLPAKVKAGGYGSFESLALDFPQYVRTVAVPWRDIGFFIY